MAFNSFHFWIVFPFVFCLYWAIPSRWRTVRKWFLILVSYLLYLNWKPAFGIVLFGVTAVTFIGARFVERQRHPQRLVGIFSVLALLPLTVFKYDHFISDNVNAVLSAVGLHFTLPGLNWAVPVGISFFTFQSVGYLFDVYYRRISAEQSFSDYVLFVSFFPQILSGPISKASELLPQIKHFHPFNYAQGVSGLKILLWGMFLKVVVADRLGLYVDVVYGNYTHYAGSDCLLSTILYSLQIYSDFAGYSFMAMGIARMLGFEVINNFRRPYFSVSVTDFWRRWHISLSRWLKDYVYIPLGGSRCSRARTYWNVFVTFLVSGIWHGANWTFIVWGMIHGVAQIIEKWLGFQRYEGHSKMVRAGKIFLTFALVNTAWIFFRMDSLSDACSFISHIFTDFSNGEILTAQRMSMMVALPILLFKDFRDEFFRHRFRVLDNLIMRRLVYLFLFVLIIFIGVLDSSQFIYVKF